MTFYPQKWLMTISDSDDLNQLLTLIVWMAIFFTAAIMLKRRLNRLINGYVSAGILIRTQQVDRVLLRLLKGFRIVIIIDMGALVLTASLKATIMTMFMQLGLTIAVFLVLVIEARRIYLWGRPKKAINPNLITQKLAFKKAYFTYLTTVIFLVVSFIPCYLMTMEAVKISNSIH